MSAKQKSRLEEAPHIRSAFQHPLQTEAGKLKLVLRLRDIAIEHLEPVTAKLPRPMSDNIRAAYQTQCISTEWDLTTTDAYEFYFVTHNAGLSKSEQNAAALLYACSEALEENTVPDHLQQQIVDAYAGLDADAIDTGKKFTAGRKPNSGGPIRKAIAKLLKKDPAAKNPVLWKALSDAPPRGWTFFDNRVGKYCEGPGSASMNYGRFCNVTSEERGKLKP